MATPFPGLLHLTVDTYLIMQSIKQGGIKDFFFFFFFLILVFGVTRLGIELGDWQTL